MSKKNFLIICLQVVVITVFVFIAAGSGGTNKSMVSDTAARGFAQGFACGVNGFIQVGPASSKSSCYTLCERKGYSAYCFTDAEGVCFCK